MKVLYTLIAFLVLLVDQVVKEYLIPVLDNGNNVEIFSYLRLIGAWNSGISFGLFDTLKYSQIIFSCTSIVIVLILAGYLVKTKSKLFSFSLSLIIGGALGNIIDRLRFGAVYDFIDFYIGNWHWPAFNLADAFIVLGMIFLIFKWYCYDKIFFKKTT